jgi:UDP-N-acetylmuramate dehydrogenase
MTVTEQIPLKDLTTLRVGGPARFVATIDTLEDIPLAVSFARERHLPFVVLGEGSNVLPDDSGYEGVILLMRIPGVAWQEEEGATLATVGAGVRWDDFVRECAGKNLWGLENLAGIPGTVGAAPVQNIGAYGAEVRTTVRSVRAYDATTGARVEIPASECTFTYRDSRFKHEANLIITHVTFALTRDGGPQVEYTDLIRARDEGADLTTPSAIGNTVRAIRALKFPDLRAFGTAGSFFKNPIVAQEVYDALSARYEAEARPYGGIPMYPVPGQVKIPLAFILDKFLSLRGHRIGKAFLFGNQPLVLVGDQGATAREIDALAHDIETRVHDATGITIEREVRMLAAHEAK